MLVFQLHTVKSLQSTTACEFWWNLWFFPLVGALDVWNFKPGINSNDVEFHSVSSNKFILISCCYFHCGVLLLNEKINIMLS